jgi:hypothetical protein
MERKTGKRWKLNVNMEKWKKSKPRDKEKILIWKEKKKRIKKEKVWKERWDRGGKNKKIKNKRKFKIYLKERRKFKRQIE